MSTLHVHAKFVIMNVIHALLVFITFSCCICIHHMCNNEVKHTLQVLYGLLMLCIGQGRQ